MTLVTAWVRPPPQLQTAWFGPDGRIEQLLEQHHEAQAIAEVIGVAGPPGPPIDIFNLPLAPAN